VAVIDRDGLLYGDRLAKCSDAAQLWFPRYFASSNTCARFELNYEKLLTTVFASLKKPPTKSEFWNHMVEYNKNFLLFTYDVAGVIWGQWWTAEHFLQKYPLNADKRTPVPPEEPFQHWKNAYYELKKQQSAKPLDLNTYVINTEISKDFKTFQKISSGVGVGEGIGIGEGKGKTKIPPKAVEPPDWVPLQAWNDYMDMRREIKKPMTEKAQILAFKKLAKLKARGHPPEEVLNQSVMNSYQGLFEVKDLNLQPQLVKPATVGRNVNDLLRERETSTTEH
jgi:hypothetical protein